jgi:hemoglobin
MIFQSKTAGLALLFAATLLAAPAMGLAADMPSANRAGADPIVGDGVYKAFHGQAGIDRIVDDFVVRISTDPRIAKRFDGANLDHLRLELKAQVCYLVGGPCAYEGKDMKSTHTGMGLENRDFNDLAEDLQKAMDKEGVPFASQNRLLSKLAPMQRAIVTK